MVTPPWLHHRWTCVSYGAQQRSKPLRHEPGRLNGWQGIVPGPHQPDHRAAALSSASQSAWTGPSGEGAVPHLHIGTKEIGEKFYSTL